MDRMTKFSRGKYTLPQGKGSFRRIAERLAAYEDTGLEPEEIKELIRSNSVAQVKAKTKQRVFISGAITGTTDYMERFEKAKKLLEAADFAPINPTMISAPLIDAEYQWHEYMDITLLLLKQSDAILMLDGWEASRGACVEYSFAQSFGMVVLYEKDLS